jgi:predicted enzyme related to lactoylglutathione lyase
MKHAIQNFQIPVTDFTRARTFYSTLMGYDLEVMETPQFQLGIFQADPGGVGGTIIKSDGLSPSATGTMVYLHAGEDLQPHLDRIEKAGGSIDVPKTQLGPGMGYFAIFRDTEGNRVGLYSEG